MKTIRQEVFGKATLRIVETAEGLRGIILREGTKSDPIEGEDEASLWTRLMNEAGKSHPDYFGWSGAVARFKRLFPGGFESEEFDMHERDYKDTARRMILSELPLEAALLGEADIEAALRAFRATNLLSPFEKVRLQDLFRGEQGAKFLQGAAQFTRGDRTQGLARMKQAAEPHDVGKWTTYTYLPYFWNPETEIFLKPEVSKDFATRVGHPFQTIYSAQADIAVYNSLLDLGKHAWTELADLQPRDNIDIQSFIWVVGAYKETDASELSMDGGA
ncbi:hypothetical protein [Hyphomonas oceanitis]|uniref:Uncharacterized protein n=1 Tax=Hyphomonas oceanitis SCH89 TaxID=1280953 RepID=A0A059G2L1_9PROT|nr:hypothetical protein [Hyphomonas oceanitis]KDA00718.1 hypothetical protein HOC_19191 [Hyphomonas oceanitis SCH89]